jgi:protein MpaA
MMRSLFAIACVWFLGGCVSSRPVEIGRSVDGVPILAEDHGSGPRVYLIGLIHGDEAEGFSTLDEIRTILRDHPGVRVRLIPTMNPDGQSANARGNARGVDLNRNWPASNYTPAKDRGPAALSEPETAAVFADLMRFDPDVLIVLHSIRRGGPFVNFDGPDSVEHLAVAFAVAAARSDPRWSVVPSMGYPTPGSLGTFAGSDLRIPTLTIEFERGHVPDPARTAAGAGIDAVLRVIAPGIHRLGPPTVASNPGAPR